MSLVTGNPGGALPSKEEPLLPADSAGIFPCGCPDVLGLSSFTRPWCSVGGTSPGFFTTRCEATPPSTPPPFATVTRGSIADIGTPTATLVVWDLDDGGGLVTLEGFGRDWCVFGTVWFNSVAVVDGVVVRGSCVWCEAVVGIGRKCSGRGRGREGAGGGGTSSDPCLALESAGWIRWWTFDQA